MDYICKLKVYPKCWFCGERITEFRDKLSYKEFRISGLCQKCQDEVFKTKDRDKLFSTPYDYED